jgi:phosphatidylinositol-3-phosphatase
VPLPRCLQLAFVLSIFAICTGCRGLADISNVADPATCAAVRNADEGTRVVVLMLDNQWFDAVYESPAAPYLNGLIKEGAFATNYYGSTFPSIGNYLMLTSGTIHTNDNLFGGVITDENVVEQFCSNGISWKAYQDGLPDKGYVGDRAYPYVRPHNPFAYYGEVVYHPEFAANMVPLQQLFQDLDQGTLPSYSFITPSQVHNMHDCPIGQSPCENDVKVDSGDVFLSQVVPKILNSPSFQRNGLLIILTDHAWSNKIVNGGGHVVWLALGPKAKKGYRSDLFYQHPSTLRLIADLLDFERIGAAANAPDMSEFLVASPAPDVAPGSSSLPASTN